MNNGNGKNIGMLGSFTHWGEKGDATSLENMLTALDAIDYGNKLRVNDNYFRD